MTPDELDSATAKLLSQPIPGGPSEELTAATINALKAIPQQAQTQAPTQSRTFRRSTVMKIIGYSSLVTAASVAIVFGVAFFSTPHRSAASDFELAMDNASKAKTLKFDNVTIIVKPDGKKTSTHIRTYITEKAVRSENLDTSAADKPGPLPILSESVFQVESKKAIDIDYKKKTYRPAKVSQQELALIKSKTLIDEFREMKANAKDVQAEKDEVINGKTFNVYSITLKKLFGLPFNDTARIWIDPKKNLPVKLVIELGASAQYILDNIVFDSEMDEELFSLTPKGFQETKE